MYGRAHRTVGLTLIEMTLVVATLALLAGLALPAVRAMIDSFQSEGGTKSIIHAALSSARTMALTHQRYIGVRFQKACVSNDPADPLKGLVDAPQYMIFIVQEEPKKMGGLGNGFRAMEGHEPIKLPGTTGVMNLEQGNMLVITGRDRFLSGATTFSIVFSPSGKLVVMWDVRVRNRDGVYQPRNDPGSTKVSHDDVFNSVDNICLYKEGMFIQDDYSRLPNDGVDLGLGEEYSVTQFVIYDARILRALWPRRPGDPSLNLYITSLDKDKTVYVSPYTGDLISSE